MIATRLFWAFLSIAAAQSALLQPTAAPSGPYHVEGRRIVDARGRPYLVRGVELPAGAWSATALVTIRQRLNMNAVRIPAGEGDRARVAEVVRMANRLELLAIVEADSAPASFAAAFRDNPNVFFAISSQDALAALRSAGAAQPAILRGFAGDDPNAVFEMTPRYADPASWQQPEVRGPVLVNDLDPRLDEDSPECAAFPAEPGAAGRLLDEKLDSFDAQQISWTISSFRPGRLITDYRYFIGTKLDDGWTCGRPGNAGIGMLLLAHLWNIDPHGLFAVNGDAGNYLLPIGGRAHAYGPILADRELVADLGKPLPARLGNVSVRITDSKGVIHTAAMLYTDAGWAHLTFVVPADAAPGRAEVAVVRADGSRSVAPTLLERVAPGLLSASIDGRGIAKTWYSQSGQGELAAFECPADCAAVPIPLAHGIPTTLRLIGTGFRHAASVRVMVGGVAAPVLRFGPMAGEPGRDQILIRLPDGIIGIGEADLVMWADGVPSNVLRIACGARVTGARKPI